jgi:hypothetical protein
LRIHSLTHLGIKFQCYVPGCASSFSCKKSLLSHFKRNHRLTTEEKETFLSKLNIYVAAHKHEPKN